MTVKNYLVALAILDEATSIEPVSFEPIGDLSTEIDKENETAAFVGRPDPKRELETKSMKNIDTTSGGTGKSPFAEAAGLL
ncbi:hypothetical protein CFH90_18280 (plasmid) [Acinetobacter johnsonii]|uniref:Uncharacterized protein n=1 Tax=Acinetobacter johnsonii TaxID=40214 RepID=A0A3Q8XG51_ACIJO|nr:hypothetical protein [Acinetobacter johnsonii]AZN65859.1 hypothetical protein CFH90_18280 [Acinetobacter johnsonii]WNL65736.1 hypothetical protein [Klebsiella oxytoca]